MSAYQTAYGVFITFMKNRISMIAKYKILIEIFTLILIIAVGISMRVEDLKTWHQYEHRTFLNGEPLHTTFDAWFYLSLAQDLADGTYNRIDEKRGVPDSPGRPFPPPLISVMAAALNKITSFSLSWIGAVMPPVLGSMLAIPLYLLGRFYGGPVMGFTAAIVSLLYPYYIYRSNIGRFDTDCLNVTFTVTVAYLFLNFGITKSIKRYFFFGGAVITYLLFLWWWDQAPAAVTAICALPFLVALVFFYRPAKNEGRIFYTLLAATTLVVLFAVGFETPARILKSIWSNYLYITKDSAGSFPNIGITISEQSKLSLDRLVRSTTHNWPAFLFAVSGIFILFWEHRKKALFLVSIIVLSVASFTANRFLIFMIPLLALGTGYAMSLLWKTAKRFYPLYIACPILIFLLIRPLYTANKSYVQWPKETALRAEGMLVAKNSTPENAVIWAWWDHGYALTYYARRATVNDGSIHNGERTVYTAIPLTTDSYRLAANFMNFYVIRGINGIRLFYKAAGGNPDNGLKLMKKILRSGPREGKTIIEQASLEPSGKWSTSADWLEFFFPRQRRPVYLFLDDLLPKIAYWWFWFGTWDIARQDGSHPVFQTFSDIQDKNNFLTSRQGFMLNKNTGEIHLGKRSIRISSLGIRKKDSLLEKSYDNNSKYRFYYFERLRIGAIMDSKMAESVFNKLYILHQYKPEYFHPVKLRPYYQLWKVEGDRIPE